MKIFLKLTKKISQIALLAALVAPMTMYAAYQATTVIGQLDSQGNPDFTMGLQYGSDGSQGFYDPVGVEIDLVNHRLFVADASQEANRIVVYQLNNDNTLPDETADYVLGSFTISSPVFYWVNDGQILGTSTPAMAYDPNNDRLFVGDGPRVLVFDTATITTGEEAAYVLGQPDADTKCRLGSTGCGTDGQTTMYEARGLAYDTANDRLFVGESRNSSNSGRVLVFDVRPAGSADSTECGVTTNGIATGMQASCVIGRINFNAGVSPYTGNGGDLVGITTDEAISSIAPGSLAYDSTGQRLFIADTTCRISVFETDPGVIANGMAMANVIGDPDPATLNGCSVTQTDFNSPRGIGYDPANQLLFVGDSDGANRVLIFDVRDTAGGPAVAKSYCGAANTTGLADGMIASCVIGQSNFTTGTASGTPTASKFGEGSSHSKPSAFDPVNNLLYVSDLNFRRVLAFDLTDIETTMANGEAAVNVIGQADFTSQCAFNNCDTDFGYLSYWPHGNFISTALDPVNHKLFTADAFSNRIFVYNLDSTNTITDYYPDYSIGQSTLSGVSSATTQTGLNSPKDLLYVQERNALFVSDSGNNRVLVYDFDDTALATGMAATNVIGQANFTSSSASSASTGLSDPQGLAYDQDNDLLFVVSAGHHRVHVYDLREGSTELCGVTSTGIDDNMAASCVLGQANFSGTSSNRGGSVAANTLFISHSAGAPTPGTGLSFDRDRDYLYVADSGNNRVVAYDADPSVIANGADAVNVLGQANFTTGTMGGHTASSMASPSDVSYDHVTKRLFVADTGATAAVGPINEWNSNRVTVFDLTAITDGEDAVGVLGQENFTTTVMGQSSSLGFIDVRRVFVDEQNNRVYVGDSQQGRILVFDFVEAGNVTLPAARQGSSFSQAFSATGSQGTVTYSVSSGSLPDGLTLSGTTLAGTPSRAGTYSFSVRATDTVGVSAFSSLPLSFTLTVSPQGNNLPPEAFQRPGEGTTPTALIWSRMPTYSVNANSTVTGSRKVSLAFDTADVYPEVTHVAISNTADFKEKVLKPYAPTMQWDLCKGLAACGAGERTVYVKFYSKWGQATEAVAKAISYAPAATEEAPDLGPDSSAIPSGAAMMQAFSRSLRFGDRGEDVRNLQKYLNGTGAQVSGSGAGAPGSETAYFGPKTKAALAKFQEMHAAEILAPWNLTEGTGFFGQESRRFVNEAIAKAKAALGQ